MNFDHIFAWRKVSVLKAVYNPHTFWDLSHTVKNSHAEEIFSFIECFSATQGDRHIEFISVDAKRFEKYFYYSPIEMSYETAEAKLAPFFYRLADTSLFTSNPDEYEVSYYRTLDDYCNNKTCGHYTRDFRPYTNSVPVFNDLSYSMGEFLSDFKDSVLKSINPADFSKYKEIYKNLSSPDDYWLEKYLGKGFNNICSTYADLSNLLEAKDSDQKKNEDLEAANKNQADIKAAGDKGEQEVSYALKWLPEDYVIVKGHTGDKDSIELKYDDISDEPQEFDHIVVGHNGVFLIETKNYSGTITIDNSGNWIQEKNGEKKGIRNPLMQVDRHHKVLSGIIREVLNKDYIQDIICIANDSAIIEGATNSHIPLVKSDTICYYIQNLNTGVELSPDVVKKIVDNIYKYER